MRVHRLRLLAGFAPILSACLSESAGPAADAAADVAALGYTAVDLGTLGGTWSEAYGINASGQIVGLSSVGPGSPHAFIWEDGIMTDLGTLWIRFTSSPMPSPSTAPARTVGGSQAASGREHAFAWKNGVMTDLVRIPGGI